MSWQSVQNKTTIVIIRLGFQCRFYRIFFWRTVLDLACHIFYYSYSYSSKKTSLFFFFYKISIIILGIFPKKIKNSSEIAFYLKYIYFFIYFYLFFIYIFSFFSKESIIIPKKLFFTSKNSTLFSIMLTYAHLCSGILF